jgi:transposase InsO family protein
MLAVADAWNHRVLLWNAVPRAHNQPADVVLGQADFTGNLANRGGATGPDTLDWCYGVSFIGDSLVVCDTGNRRVLIWRAVPSENGTPADIVLGQREMTSRDESAGADVGPVGMRWPHMTALVAGNFLVADAGMNRVMIWNGLPDTDGAPCHAVLGQATLGDQDHNRAAYYPTATALNMPYGLAESGGRLLVADTANSRLVGWSTDAIGMDAPATMLAGQHTFTAKGDNRWAAAARDSLCWPYGLGAYGSTVVIADSGNNRVLIWDVAS